MGHGGQFHVSHCNFQLTILWWFQHFIALHNMNLFFICLSVLGFKHWQSSMRKNRRCFPLNFRKVMIVNCTATWFSLELSKSNLKNQKYTGGHFCELKHFWRYVHVQYFSNIKDKVKTVSTFQILKWNSQANMFLQHYVCLSVQKRKTVLTFQILKWNLQANMFLQHYVCLTVKKRKAHNYINWWRF
jgi:hypothetical protein